MWPGTFLQTSVGCGYKLDLTEKVHFCYVGRICICSLLYSLGLCVDLLQRRPRTLVMMEGDKLLLRILKAWPDQSPMVFAIADYHNGDRPWCGRN